MRYLIPFCAAVFLVACSDSPTGPTPVTEVPVEQPPTTGNPNPNPNPNPTPANGLYWDRFGSGCPASTAPNPIPTGDPTTLERLSDGSLSVMWFPYTPAGGPERMLSTRFVPIDGGGYALCSWELSDI